MFILILIGIQFIGTCTRFGEDIQCHGIALILLVFGADGF